MVDKDILKLIESIVNGTPLAEAPAEMSLLTQPQLEKLLTASGWVLDAKQTRTNPEGAVWTARASLPNTRVMFALETDDEGYCSWGIWDEAKFERVGQATGMPLSLKSHAWVNKVKARVARISPQELRILQDALTKSAKAKSPVMPSSR